MGRSGYRDVALRVRRPGGGVAADVLVRTPDGTPTGAVARAIATAVGAADGAGSGLESGRLGRILDEGERFGDCGLVHGDEVVVVSASPDRVASTRPPAASFELVIEAGPDAGMRTPLGLGEWRIGRLATCAVQLTDPEASREHLLIRVTPVGVTARDLASLNGTWRDEKPMSGEQPVGPGTRLRIGETVMRVEPPPGSRPSPAETDLNFIRPPRVHRPVPPAQLRLEAPPADPHPVRVPFAAALAPVVLGVVLWLVTEQLTMLLFIALTPIIAVWSWLEDRQSGRRRFKRESRLFHERSAAFVEDVRAAREAEALRRREDAPDARSVAARATERRDSLWERRVGDPDFLSVRVGTADLPCAVTPVIEHGGSDRLRAEAASALAEGGVIAGAPAVVSLRDLGAVGMCGPREEVGRVAMAAVAQAVVLQSPTDVVVVAALHDADVRAWDWLKWLPHARSADLLLGGSQIAVGTGAAAALFDRLEALVATRTEQDRLAMLGPREIRPWVLLVVDDRVVPRRLALVNVLENARDAGILVLWMGEERARIPGACRGILEVAPDGERLEIVTVETGERLPDVRIETYARDALDRIAWSLAPLRDAEGTSGPAHLPRRLALLELLDLVDLDADGLAEIWQASDGTLSAAVGASEQGIFYLDLRRDGPHALVAGMTGSGKSELLRTLVASLALAVPPNRLNLLLVDYKGGSAFRDCSALPHTVGMVTDLNADLSRRALTSLYAELKRREVILDEAGAKDLDELRRRSPAVAPPALLIVIDEFATLAKEVPEFVEGVVDVAQRGRSLGVHMVLATQRPGGAVTPNIRANTNLRIALRVNAAADSEDVIESPDASRIPRSVPGRAYVRTGSSELAAVQAAHVAGRSGRAKDEEVVVAPFTLGGMDAAAESMGTILEASDLTHIVTLANQAAETLGIRPQVSPWLPPLPEVLPLDELAGDGDSDGADPAAPAPVIGRVDEPSKQRQRPLLLEPDRVGSILVYGGPGSGKTAALWTVATSLCRLLPPNQLHIYGLDFSTGGLRPLAALPHVGAIVGQDETERIERLMRFLAEETAMRKSRLTASGALDFAQLVRSLPAAEALPRLLVLLDDYGGFFSAFERVRGGEMIDRFTRLVADGRQLGIHFAITTSQRAAIPGSLSGTIPWRVILDMASRDDLGILGVDVRGLPAVMPPGRAVVEGRLQAQLALLSQDPSPEAQLEALTRLAERARERYGDVTVPGIGTLPTSVARESLPEARDALRCPVGIGDSRLLPVEVNLTDGHLLVVGPFRSGRSTALATLAHGLGAAPEAAELHLLAPRRTPLADLRIWESVARGPEECAAACSRLRNEVAGGGRRPIVIVLDNGEDLLDGPASGDLEQIARTGRDADVRIIAAVERQAAGRAFMGWFPEVKKDGHGILLDPNIDIDGNILGVYLPRDQGPFPPGRGYLCRRGEIELIQVAA